MPEERPRCSHDVLRLPSRALETSTDNKSHRINLRHDSLATSKNQRVRFAACQPSHDVQAGSIRTKEMEKTKRSKSTDSSSPRKEIRRRNSAGRRLKRKAEHNSGQYLSGRRSRSARFPCLKKKRFIKQPITHRCGRPEREPNKKSSVLEHALLRPGETLNHHERQTVRSVVFCAQ